MVTDSHRFYLRYVDHTDVLRKTPPELRAEIAKMAAELEDKVMANFKPEDAKEVLRCVIRGITIRYVYGCEGLSYWGEE